jgi:GntR family transcriptional regulator of vanillate catabolism
MAHLATPEARQVLMTAQEQHHAIVDAIGQRQGSRVEALTREHARLVLRFLHSALRDREAFRRVPGGVLIQYPEFASLKDKVRNTSSDASPIARP